MKWRFAMLIWPLMAVPHAAAEGLAAADSCLAATPRPTIGALLPQSAARIMPLGQQRVVILALGSSSTRGVGASSWAATYPEVMQRELQRLRPGLAVEIINEGRNGETIPGQIARVDAAVRARKPDIVIWQLGANDVVMPWGGLGADYGARIVAAVRAMQTGGADVILMDVQRTPVLMWSSAREAVLALVAGAAQETGAGHFRRHDLFAAAEAAGMPASAFASWDGLHNNDAGYDCTGRALARAIDAAWRDGAKKPARRKPMPRQPSSPPG